MDKRTEQGVTRVQQFVEAHSGLSIDADYLPPLTAGTNFVVFGHYNETPVAIKRFATSERKRQEEWVLRLFAPSGTVPTVFPFEDERIIVMDRLPGIPFFMVEEALDRDELLSFPSFVCMDDFHYANMIVEGSKFQGFIDLEISRYANEVLALAAAMNSITHCYQPERWNLIRQGYEEGIGRKLDDETLRLAAEVASFTHWIRFSWYWGTDELPDWAVKRNTRVKVVSDIKKSVEGIEALELYGSAIRIEN